MSKKPKEIIVFQPTGEPKTINVGDQQLKVVQAAQKAVGRELSLSEIGTIAAIVKRDAHRITVVDGRFDVKLIFNDIDPETVINERGEKLTDEEKLDIVHSAENHRTRVHEKVLVLNESIAHLKRVKPSGRQRRRIKRELKRKNNK